MLVDLSQAKRRKDNTSQYDAGPFLGWCIVLGVAAVFYGGLAWLINRITSMSSTTSMAVAVFGGGGALVGLLWLLVIFSRGGRDA